MTMIFWAIALALAVPAAAQGAPAAHAHADHAPKETEAQPHDCKACCEQMKAAGGEIDCMPAGRVARTAAPADHHGHAQ